MPRGSKMVKRLSVGANKLWQTATEQLFSPSKLKDKGDETEPEASLPTAYGLRRTGIDPSHPVH